VFEGGTLFDGENWIADAAVVIQAGVVIQVGPRKTTESPAGARRVSLGGRWITPGLVDCRAFVVGRAPDEVPRPQARRFKTAGPVLAHRGVHDAHRMLSGGITGLAQLGDGDVEYVEGLRDAIRIGLIAGPTIVSAGRALSPIGGGIEAMHERGDDPERRLPGTGMFQPSSRQNATVATAPDNFRKQIRQSFVDGADMVMLLLTGPESTEKLAMSDEELATVTDEAQRVGARVACQALGNTPAKAAIRAGVDLLVLGPAQPDADLVSLLAKGRTAWAPGLAGRPDGDGKALRTAVKDVHAQGGRLVIGTGWRRERPVPFANELAAIMASGVSVADALTIATVGGGATLGLVRGRLAKGEPANFVAFDFDPRVHPEAMGEPATARLIVHSVPARRFTPLRVVGTPSTSASR
jgi:imidazolonepropionase-like amidohydrolase